MTDKISLIIAEIKKYKKLIDDPILSDNDLIIGERNACNHILRLIDSLQQEPHKELYDKLSKLTEDALAKETKESWNEFLDNKPVSEDLEGASRKYATESAGYDENGNEVTQIIKEEVEAFKAGAKWKFYQLEKNRLAACDRQTEEEAEIERDFVMGVIENEHRMPTFDDAIKYGMRLQKEQMMAKVIDIKGE